MTNIFDLPRLPLSEEAVDVLTETRAIRIERIVSDGQTSQWYDQEETEFVVLLTGTATIEYTDGQQVVLVKGDTLVIPARQKHRVCYTSKTPPCVWLCIFYR